MHPCPGNWVAIRRAFLYYARAAHAFSAGIKCRQSAAEALRKITNFSSISKVINQDEIVEDFPRVREMNRLYFPILIDLAPPITLSGMIILFFNFIVLQVFLVVR